MAFNAARQAALLRTATAIIGQEAGAFARGTAGLLRQSASYLYERLKAHYGAEDGWSAQQVRGLAQRALQAVKVGEQANNAPGVAVKLGQLPDDPALVGRVETVRYDVVVTGFAADGTRIEFRTEILTDGVLSRNAVEQIAIENMPSLSRYRPTGSPSVVTDGSQPAPTVQIITVGRRP